jgi:hypothetical protein
MRITESILDAAIRRATEAGLFSRRSTSSEMQANREIMRSILDAAVAADTADAAMQEERSAEIRPDLRHDTTHPAHGCAQHERRARQSRR